MQQITKTGPYGRTQPIRPYVGEPAGKPMTKAEPDGKSAAKAEPEGRLAAKSEGRTATARGTKESSDAVRREATFPVPSTTFSVPSTTFSVPSTGTAMPGTGRSGASHTDTVELSGRSGYRVGAAGGEYGSAVSGVLRLLSARYPGVQLIVGGNTDEKSLRQTAASLGRGAHLILTDGFLERMGSSEEDFKACAEMLTEAMEQLAGGLGGSGGPGGMAGTGGLGGPAGTCGPGGLGLAGVGILLERDKAVSWVLPEERNDLEKLLEDFKKQAQRREELLSGKKDTQSDIRYRVSPTSYNTAAYYAKLARAGSRGAIQTVMSEARRGISSLTLVTCYGSDKERQKASRAIRSIQKLLLRGRRKMNRLSEEQLLAIRKKRAKERAEEERERQAKLELKKKQMNRRTADGAILLEGRFSDSALDWYKRCHPEQYREAAAGMGEMSDMGLSSGGAGAGAGLGFSEGGSFTAEQVVVSAEIAF